MEKLEVQSFEVIHFVFTNSNSSTERCAMRLIVAERSKSQKQNLFAISISSAFSAYLLTK